MSQYVGVKAFSRLTALQRALSLPLINCVSTIFQNCCPFSLQQKEANATLEGSLKNLGEEKTKVENSKQLLDQELDKLKGRHKHILFKHMNS